MTEKHLTMPEILLLAGTRVALGAGVGLLMADKLSPDARKAAGKALFAVGALTTVPLAMTVMSCDRNESAQPAK